MANEFLYKARDAAGNVIYTASKEDTDGKPTTRVEFKEAQPMVLTGSNIADELALPVKRINAKIETIRDYTFTVTSSGVHVAADAFLRGYGTKPLDVSRYKNISLKIKNIGSQIISLSAYAELRFFEQTSNYSTNDFYQTGVKLKDKFYPQGGLAAGKSVYITPFEEPMLESLHFPGMSIHHVLNDVGDSAQITILGEPR